MIYTQRCIPVILLGIALVALSYMTEAGSLNSLIEYLNIKKKVSEIANLSHIFGIVAIVCGIIPFFMPLHEGKFDYFLGAIPGVMFVLLIAMIVKWGLAPWAAILSKAYGPISGEGEEAKYLHKVLGLNHVLLGVLAGIIVANFFRIPSWAEHGVRTSRLALKVGVILLGTIYSFHELKRIGGLSLVLITCFTLGSVAAVLWLGNRYRLNASTSGVLSSGLGVCGVSATVAAAPVVQARSIDIAYAIGTILLWGMICMFVFPSIGHYLNLNSVQFGAWAGTGILNSAQVTAAALGFQPDGVETLQTAETFNITRVLFLPIIVVWLGVWYVRKENIQHAYINMGELIIDKFPIFVLGFVIMFALSSQGVFGPKRHHKGKYFDNRAIAQQDLLTTEEKLVLEEEKTKLILARRKQALQRLIDRGKIMSESDEVQLRGLILSKKINADGIAIIERSRKLVFHQSPRIKIIKQIIEWLFAFGLVGLGMQITFTVILQAGGKPLVVGCIIGTAKAVGSLFVIMALNLTTIS